MDLEIDEILKQELLKDAVAYEEALENDPYLKDVKAPADQFDKIVGQLKREGVWEEEIAEEVCPEAASNAYKLLSEKDQKALLIGRRMMKRSKWRELGKVAGMLVLALACVFGVSMTGEANRAYVLRVIDTVMNGDLDVKVDNKDSDILYDEEEIAAYSDLESKLGGKIVRLKYKPKGAKYLKHTLDSSHRLGELTYEYNGLRIGLYCYADVEAASKRLKFWGDSEKVNSIQIKSFKQNVDIWRIEGSNKINYATQFAYSDMYYVVVGEGEEEVIEKVIESIDMEK